MTNLKMQRQILLISVETKLLVVAWMNGEGPKLFIKE